MYFGNDTIDWKVNINYGIEHTKAYVSDWFESSSGKWFTVDLGATVDKRYCTLTIEGSNTDIVQLEALLTDVDTGIGYGVFNLTTTDGEEVFGIELDYTDPLQVLLINEPVYTYLSLDWAQLEIKLLLNPGYDAPLKGTPVGIQWDTIPWNFIVKRNNKSSKKTVIYYNETPEYVWDEYKSKSVSAAFTLTREEAVWLKLELLNKRADEFQIPNTYFDLDRSDNTTVTVKVKDFREQRTNRNLYRIELEFLIYE